LPVKLPLNEVKAVNVFEIITFAATLAIGVLNQAPLVEFHVYEILFTIATCPFNGLLGKGIFNPQLSCCY
jgi:hypothetical protein